jgi:hypothetical protein
VLRAVVLKQRANRLDQVVEIQGIRGEDPLEWDRGARGDSRSLYVVV